MRDSYWRRGLLSVIKGIATFGARRPFVPGDPFLVVWDVTYACNLRCRHCYANAGRQWPDELSTEEAKRVIDTFDKAGVVAIAWSGGEPMMRPDIYELSRYAYEKGIYVAMATNGTLINENTAQKLWDSGVRFLQVSLDGANPRTHDEFRGVDGAWERATNAIKIASKMGFFINVAMTATKDNWREIPSVIDLSEKLGARWRAPRAHPCLNTLHLHPAHCSFDDRSLSPRISPSH
jgi:MoaA/NifB/PqqE/SkfB family radical SAM enzyme